VITQRTDSRGKFDDDDDNNRPNNINEIVIQVYATSFSKGRR